MSAIRAAIVVLLLCAHCPVVRAQPCPFVTDEQYRWMVGEISGDAAYEHLRVTTRFHKPRGGTPGLMEVARYVEETARGYGLEDVKLIRQPDDAPEWRATRAELWITEPEVQLVASLVQTPLHLADNSRSADVTAEVVDVGEGARESDYAGKDVRGKLVLGYANASVLMQRAVWERGAAGVIYHPDPRAIDWPLNTLSHPDQIRWSSVPIQTADGKPATFAFVLSHRQAVALQNYIASSKRPVRMRAVVESELGKSGWQVMVEGFIRGTDISTQDIVLTSHMQEEKFSANDDGSGVANMLEIARAMTKLIREGKLPRPRRSIRFWWTTEISSERQYFADHPDESRKMLCNINQDMVGANQGQDLLRVQNVTRLPFSRWHFLNDVTEAVVEFVARTNTQQLPEIQAGTPAAPYPRPILSRLGTRHRYSAAMVPYHSSTDHMTFNEAPIGVPGITFTNWPDNFIHTSDDDLWNIDRTQLQRNAFAVSLIAYAIARAGKEEVPAIAAEVYGRAATRLGEDFRIALALLSEEGMGPARNQIEQAALRERQGILSLSSLDTTASAEVGRMLAGMDRLERTCLEALSAQSAGAAKGAIPTEQTDSEKELGRMTPALTAGPAEFLTRRGARVPEGLNGHMADEVLNYVNGKRSGLAIYRAVSAEARRAGPTYYGRVTAQMVREYLNSLRDAGLIRL